MCFWSERDFWLFPLFLENLLLTFFMLFLIFIGVKFLIWFSPSPFSVYLTLIVLGVLFIYYALKLLAIMIGEHGSFKEYVWYLRNSGRVFVLFSFKIYFSWPFFIFILISFLFFVVAGFILFNFGLLVYITTFFCVSLKLSLKFSHKILCFLLFTSLLFFMYANF